MNEVLLRYDQFDWTPERLGELKVYVDLGKTPWHIASLMHCSRSTVIEAMVKLMARPEGSAPVDHEKEPRVETRDAKPITLAWRYERDPDTHRVPTTPDLRPARDRPQQKLIHIPSHPIELLTSVTCRYPIGDVGHEGFRFCMERKTDDNSPYCAVHQSLAIAYARR